MKQTVNFSTFQTAFEQLRPNNFSYEGLTALFDWVEQQEDDTGIEQELDVISLCCDFSELTIEEIIRQYNIDCDDVEDDSLDQCVIDFLCDNTTVLPMLDNGSIIFVNF